MISMYSDAATGQPFESRAKARAIQFRRESTSTWGGGYERPTERAFDESVTSTGPIAQPSGDTLHDDSLDAARGMALSIVLGLGCWMVIGAVVWFLFF